MSFFDTIIDLGKSAYNYVTGNSLLSSIATTALTGYALNQLTQSVNKDNTAATSNTTAARVDPGQKLTLSPDQNNRIPVLYGEAFIPGIVTDAHLSADRTQMTYVFTLCEQTGSKLSDGSPSNYTFEDVYLADQRVVFKSDGITVDYTVDRDGNQDISLRDLITIRLYTGGSNAVFQEQPNGSPGPITRVDAWTVVPEWTPLHSMNGLIFAVITVIYNAEKNSRGVPTPLFHIINDMTQPGDCLYDYATNTRYGAGIAPEDIYDE